MVTYKVQVNRYVKKTIKRSLFNGAESFATPMDAMSEISKFLVNGYGSYHSFDCYQYVDNVKTARQWTLQLV